MADSSNIETTETPEPIVKPENPEQPKLKWPTHRSVSPPEPARGYQGMPHENPPSPYGQPKEPFTPPQTPDPTKK